MGRAVKADPIVPGGGRGGLAHPPSRADGAGGSPLLRWRPSSSPGFSPRTKYQNPCINLASQLQGIPTDGAMGAHRFVTGEGDEMMPRTRALVEEAERILREAQDLRREMDDVIRQRRRLKA